jgi:hypothetical protein
MNPKNKKDNDPGEPGMPESFPQPRTIPGGWEIAAFYAPEREDLKKSDQTYTMNASLSQTQKPYEQS